MYCNETRQAYHVERNSGRVHATVVAMEKREVLQILSVCS
jgi:hypothetical protein